MDIVNITTLNVTYSVGVCQCTDLTLANSGFQSQYAAWLFTVLTVLILLLRTLKSCKKVKNTDEANEANENISDTESTPLPTSTSITISARDFIV